MIIDINAWVGTWPFRSLPDNTPQKLVAHLENAGIDMAAVSQVEAILHRNVQPANEKLAEEVEPFRERLIPIATINPTYAKWEDDLTACYEKLKMKGVRLFPEYHGYAVDGREAQQIVAAATEKGLPIFIPARIEDRRGGSALDPGRGIGVGQIANLVAAVADATIVVTNARGISRSPLWRRTELREKNWYVDLSLTEIHYNLHHNVASMRDLADMIEEGGADHVIFGSHTPFSYAASALVKLATLPVDEKTRAEIGYKRAAAMFGLTVEAQRSA